MTDEKRSEMVEKAIDRIQKIKELAEETINRHAEAKANSQHAAANVMMFCLLIMVLIESVMTIGKDIAEEDTAERLNK